MKTLSGKLTHFSGKLTRNARLILFIITLLLFILAAGAPCATGSVGIQSNGMILLLAVVLGLTAGLCRARIGKRKYRYEELKAPLLVLVAFIPQYLIFFLPSTRALIPNRLASILYIGSLVPLIVFAFLNIRKNSFWPISVGFLMNALTIVLNGGWMPVSPQMVQKLHPDVSQDKWQIGERLGFSKDIVLQPDATRLWFLSDRFSLPDWLNYQVAFSLGDIFIFTGVVLLLWSLGGKQLVIDKGEKQ